MSTATTCSTDSTDSTEARGWPLERVLFAMAGTMTLLSVAARRRSSRRGSCC